MFKAFGRFWINYANFNDRATRGDYWWSMLCLIVIGIIISILIVPQVTYDSMGNMSNISGAGTAIMVVYLLFTLACIIPSISVVVRRLHDIGKSGWWYLLSFVPCVGGVIIFVFMCLAGTPGPNKYGEDPKAVR